MATERDGAVEVTELPHGAEQHTAFRLGQLLLLFEVAAGLGIARLDLERLGYYDFFAANPFLIFTAPSSQRTELVMAGFDSRALSYQSSSQRFANRRARLQHDLAILVAFGLVNIAQSEGRVIYTLTERGQVSIAQLRALYADAYRTSARLVLDELRRLSDTRLVERSRSWLRAEALLIDLYDSNVEPDESGLSAAGDVLERGTL